MQSFKLQATHNIPERYFTEFNSVKHFAYNRMKQNPDYKLSGIYALCKQMNNIGLMNSAFIQMAVSRATSLHLDNSICFARKEFQKLKRNKGDKAEYLKAKNSSIYLRGSKCDPFGNRKARLDLANKKIIFKPKYGVKYEILLSPDRRFKQLKYLQSVCERNEAYFTLEIKRDSVSIIVDESIFKNKPKSYKPKDGRFLAIDMNPNYIGLVIKNKQHIFHKEIIDLTQLNNIDNKNKKLHETAQIAKHITDLAIHYQCSIAFEELIMKGKQHNKGKKYNKLVNQWNCSRFIQILKKHCTLLDIKALPIHAQYSSFVGCMTNPDDYDSIAAAIEIARRAIDCVKHSTYKIFPKIEIKDLDTRWKEMLRIEISHLSWKELYAEFKKKPKLSYRNLFSLKEFDGFSFRLKSDKSYVKIHTYVSYHVSNKLI